MIDEPRTLDTRQARFDAVNEYAQVDRAAFDALPDAHRAAILAELRAVADNTDDVQHRRATRGYLGTTVRHGPQPAAHVTHARDLVRRFTRVIPPPVDNTPAGRRARLFAATDERGARAALAGATIADMREIGGGSIGWKRDQHVSHLIEVARVRRIKDALVDATLSGETGALLREYERARDAAARADRQPPTRPDMRPRVEVFRGRKLRTVKGTEWGTVSTFVNGHPVSVNSTVHGSGPEGLDRAAAQLRRDVIAADERRITEPDAYPAEWFTGAPDADPAVIAYCTYVADRDRADREAVFADDQAAAPVAFVSGWGALAGGAQ